MRKVMVLAAAAFAFALAAPYAAWSQEGPPAAAAVGALAPDIQIQDTINGDGRTSLADFKGEVVFLEFWATT